MSEPAGQNGKNKFKNNKYNKIIKKKKKPLPENGFTDVCDHPLPRGPFPVF